MYFKGEYFNKIESGYITRFRVTYEYLNLRVFRDIFTPAVPGSSSWEMRGLGHRGTDDEPEKLVKSELIYLKNLNIPELCYELEYKEIFKTCMEFILKNEYEVVNTILLEYSDYAPMKFKEYIFDQIRLNILCRYNREKNKNVTQYFLKSGKLYDDYNIYMNTKKMIEIYINTIYSLPKGYRFRCSKYWIHSSLIDDYKMLNIEAYNMFDSLILEVLTPIGESLYKEDEVIYKIDLNLDKIHVNKLGFNIDFNDIKIKIDSHIKDILKKCKEFKNSNKIYTHYAKRPTIKEYKFNDVILKKYITTDVMKSFEEIHDYVNKFIKDNNLLFVSYELLYDTYFIIDGKKYNNCYYDYTNFNGEIEVFIKFENLLSVEKNKSEIISLGIISNKYRNFWYGINRFENIKKVLEDKILPTYLDIDFSDIDNKNNYFKDSYNLICNKYLYNTDKYKNTTNEIKATLEIREKAVGSILSEYKDRLTILEENILKERRNVELYGIKEKEVYIKRLDEDNKLNVRIFKNLGIKSKKYLNYKRLLEAEEKVIKEKRKVSKENLNEYIKQSQLIEDYICGIENNLNINVDL